MDGSNNRHDEDGVLPDDHPHIQLFWKVVPVWHDTSLDDLDEEIGEGYACGFSAGFERGIIMTNLLPEWARGFYLGLRDYYLRSHTPQDLLDWDDHAEETARAVPVSNAGLASESREMN